MNNLSQRERTLVMLILAILPVVGLYFGWTTYQKMYRERADQLAAAAARLEELRALERTANDEADRMEVYNATSLSYDVMDRNELYADFLLGMVRDSGLELQNNNSGSWKLDEVMADDLKPDRGTLYHRIRITDMKLQGNVPQLTQFLFSFYDAAILQRIDNITIVQEAKREEDTELSITLSLTGLVLSGAEDHKDLADYGGGRTGRTFEDFQNLVIARNVFGPPNEAPTFSRGQLEQDLEVGDSLRISSFAAKDSDGEQLRYELLESELEGLTLDQAEGANTARIKSSAINEPGRYKVKVRVADNRIPQMSLEDTIVVNVTKTEPRKETPRPKKMVAPETYITSMFQKSDGESVVRIKNDDDRFELKQDDTFELDDATWTVIELDLVRRQVTLLKSEQRLTYKLGSTLDQPIEEEKTVKVVTEY